MAGLRRIFETRERCFIPFVTAGHPDLAATREIILAMAEAGADIIEVGIPFSDPVADGPIIQRSSFEALQHHYTMSDYIELVRQIRDRSDVGLLFMTYLNPVLQFGLSRLEAEASAAGLDGILITDLTPEEFEVLQKSGPLFQKLETVFLVAPTSTPERMERICAASSGFIYLVARTGVTGNQTDIKSAVPTTVARLREHTDLPIAVGFGIRSASDVEAVWRYAEGAVVGSAIVQFIDENRGATDLAQRVRTYLEKNLIPRRK